MLKITLVFNNKTEEFVFYMILKSQIPRSRVP